MSDQTCKNCKWWDDSPKHDDYDIYHGVHFQCLHEKTADARGRATSADGFHGGMPCDFDGSYDGVFTGPDFGCIHWEQRDG